MFIIFVVIMTIMSVSALPKPQFVIGVPPIVAVRPVVVVPATIAVVRPVAVPTVLGFGQFGHGFGYGHGRRWH